MLARSFHSGCEPLVLAQGSLEAAAWVAAFQEAWVVADSLAVDSQVAAEVARYDWSHPASR